MKTGWLVGVVMAYVILLIFSIVCDQVWFDSATLTSLHDLTLPSFPMSNIPVVGLIVGGITVLGGWIKAFFEVVFLRFDFWSGSYMILWYIFCLPVAIGLIASIVITLIRGVPSG